ATPTASPVVDLGYAKFKGKVDSTWGTTTYYGLRYASPPTGQWRFRAPQPIESSTYYNKSTVVDATTQSYQCIQGVPGFQITSSTQPVQPGHEDCLLVDVVVPTKPASSSLPIMVQIHGGGYATGNSELHPGNALVQQSQGSIIYVTIQYRLNAFGFLSSPEVRANGDANAGLLDQRAALDWVQRNIARFGGNPKKVTISGGSAGGGSVMNQLIMYGGNQTNPPFRAAISEFPWWQSYHNDTILEIQYRELLSATKCTNLACLRSVSSSVLDAASESAEKTGFFSHPSVYGYGDFYWGPSVDGKYIMDLPSNEWKAGRFVKVPLIVDHDQYEGVLFSNRSETTMTQETADLQGLFPAANQSFFSRLYSLYPRKSFNSTFFQRQQIFGDIIINCPTYYMATANSDAKMPTWKMVFDAGTGLHAATAPFLYINPANLSNRPLGNVMKDWFLSFTIYMNPNTKSFTTTKKPYWPQYQAAGSSN
ncbi:alpha/beta-hydrolase, partial [Myriangium duriaei CBS 260.36]